MARFNDLPPEILMQIAKDVYPADLAHFAALNRKVYHSVSDSLQLHRGRLISHDTIDDTSKALYRHLGQAPHLLWYVRKFVNYRHDLQIDYPHILSPREEKRQRDLIEEMHREKEGAQLECSKSVQSGAEIFLEGILLHSPLALLSPQKLRMWKRQVAWISKRHLATTTKVLTSFAANLTTMVICAPLDPDFLPLGDGAAYRSSPLIRYMSDTMSGDVPCLSKRPGALPFSCLRELRINHFANGRRGRPYVVNWREIAMLMKLPVLETLSVETFGKNDQSSVSWWTPSTSSVRRLDIGATSVKDVIMKHLLQAPRRLETFRMPRVKLSAIEDLLQYHAGTLTVLNIGCRYVRGDAYTLPSLRDMSVLTNLRIDYEVLFARQSDGTWPCLKNDYNLRTNLKEILPRTIRTIRIMKRTHDLFIRAEKPTSELLFMLLSLVQIRSLDFPDLKGICIALCNPDEFHPSKWRTIAGFKELSASCAEQGVDLATDELDCEVCDLMPSWLEDDHTFIGCCAY